MAADRIQTFFSCSFATAEVQLNDVFLTLCEAMALDCTNVSSGSTSTPPAVALSKMKKCDLLVAVCTRRDQLVSGGFTMPVAVRNEIGIALGREIPIILFVEDGVDIAGFENNIGTYQKFDRTTLADMNVLGKIVQTLNDSRAQLAAGAVPYISHGRDDAICERMDYSVCLEPFEDDYTWSCEVTKKLIYNKRSSQPIPASYWAEVPESAPAGTPPIEFSAVTDDSSRSIKMHVKVDKHQAQAVDVTLTPKPTPGPGDWIEFTTSARSPYLNVIWCGDPDGAPCKELLGEKYRAMDGIVPLHRTQKLTVEFKFPRAYGLKTEDIRAFAGSYTQGIDYELESETDRASVTLKTVGRFLVAKLEIERPLLHHIYGFAWNPPSKSDA